MMWYYTLLLALLVSPSLAYPREKITEKPHLSNPGTSKHRKPQAHISEFTDPDTGLNPFLDIEEGQTSMGRSATEDEIIDDTPYFDLDLVEGDASNRRWGFSEAKDTFETVPAIGRWPVLDYKDENFEFPAHPTTSTQVGSSTTSRVVDKQETMMTNVDGNKMNESLKVEEKDHAETVFASKSSVIYVAASVVAIATVILLIGACWWKTKLKNSHSATREETISPKS